MSLKREATTELNHENWNQEDPNNSEGMGTFKVAPKDILQTRVMRTAKRRMHLSAGDNAKKNVFRGFGGFNKTQPSSFDFLANLTNGNRSVGNSSTNMSETTASSSSLSQQPSNLFNAVSPNSKLFGTPAPLEHAVKPEFGMPTTQTSLLGGMSNSSKTLFNTTNPVSLASSTPFKMQATTTTSANITATTSQTPTLPTFQITFAGLTTPSTTEFKFVNSTSSTPQTISNLFGSTSANSPIASAFNTSNPAVHTTSNVFGSASTNSPIAPAFNTSNSAVHTTSNVFGSASANSPIASSFNTSNSVVQTPNVFGSASANSPIASSFNNTSNSAVHTTSNVFGSASTNSPIAPAFNTSNSAIHTTPNVFGSASANSPIAPALNPSNSTNKTTSNLFGSVSTNPPVASEFKTSNSAEPTTQSTSVLGSPFTTTSPTPSTFKYTFVSTTQEPTVFGSAFDMTSQVPRTLGSPFTNATNSNPLFTKITIINNSPKADSNVLKEAETKVNYSDDDKKLLYHYKLSALNKAVSVWINVNIDETPVCILSPIFADYEKYLKEIQDEYLVSNKANALNKQSDFSELAPKSTESINDNTAINPKNTPKTDPPNKTSVFATQSTNAEVEKPPSFSFGIKRTTDVSSASKASAAFSFGVTTTTSTSSTTTFTFPSNTTTTSSNGNPPFTFGIGKPFSFSSNIEKPAEKTNETEEEEDQPPKVEFTPIVEENSVFDKRCKVFFKKDGNFVDKGLGTMYIKKIEESGKHQLMIRANTNLGSVLVNLVLSSSIPIQRMGKNNVIMVCVPTPDSQPPPTPVLIRVKTAEEADELLETFNKYKA